MFRLFVKKSPKKRAESHSESSRNEEFSGSRKVVRKQLVYKSYTMGRRLGYR